MKTFKIVEFYVSQGEINWHTEKEQFPTLAEAQTFKNQNYSSKGFFWTGLHEYKIIETEGDQLVQTWACNSIHIQYLKSKYRG